MQLILQVLPRLQCSLYMLFMSTGTYNYKFYADYWSLYKIQVLSWHVQWHYLDFNKKVLRKKNLTYVVPVLCTFLEVFINYTSLDFVCACPKLGPSFPKQSQIFIKIIMVYTHLINSWLHNIYFPLDIFMRIDNIPVLKFKKYQYFITNKADKSLFFLCLVAMILYWYSGNQNIEWEIVV
jgi:hypothetical protein